MSWFKPSVLIIVFCSVFVGGFIAWANWAELDRIARARGQVVPSGRVQVLQSRDNGVITEILVREGDTVAAGQLLMTLDTVKIEAGVEEGRAKVAALKASTIRLQAELFNTGLSFPEELEAYPDFVSNQIKLFNDRRTSLQQETAALQAQLDLAEDELALNQPLIDRGDVARSDGIRMQRQVADLQGQIINLKNSYIKETQAELTKVEEELAVAEQQLNQRLDLREGAKIYAPVDGIVKNVRLTTVGGVLRPSDEIMQIVPVNDTMIIEAKVSPTDIAFVREGQFASVKFDAYDASIYGSAEGEVIFISPDTIVETGDGNRENVFYQVHLSIDKTTMKKRFSDQNIEMRPGMTATAEIWVGKNTVLEYLSKPITKTLSVAMREP